MVGTVVHACRFMPSNEQLGVAGTTYRGIQRGGGSKPTLVYASSGAVDGSL
jgi:hypothetical protein